MEAQPCRTDGSISPRLFNYTWEVHGYSESEMMYFKQLIRDNAHLIIEFSQEGGILNAANI